ncbi:hypothetical protein JCM8547_003307 [Rhodosporidiobolus lusitaniae]
MKDVGLLWKEETSGILSKHSWKGCNAEDVVSCGTGSTVDRIILALFLFNLDRPAAKARTLLSYSTNDDVATWIDENLDTPDDGFAGYGHLPPSPPKPEPLLPPPGMIEHLAYFAASTSRIPLAPSSSLGADHPIRLRFSPLPASTTPREPFLLLAPIGVKTRPRLRAKGREAVDAFFDVPSRRAWEKVDAAVPFLFLGKDQKVEVTRAFPSPRHRGLPTHPEIRLYLLPSSSSSSTPAALPRRDSLLLLEKTRCGVYVNGLTGAPRAPSPDTAERAVRMLDGREVDIETEDARERKGRVRARWIDERGVEHGAREELVKKEEKEDIKMGEVKKETEEHFPFSSSLFRPSTPPPRLPSSGRPCTLPALPPPTFPPKQHQPQQHPDPSPYPSPQASPVRRFPSAFSSFPFPPPPCSSPAPPLSPLAPPTSFPPPPGVKRAIVFGWEEEFRIERKKRRRES